MHDPFDCLVGPFVTLHKLSLILVYFLKLYSESYGEANHQFICNNMIELKLDIAQCTELLKYGSLTPARP